VLRATGSFVAVAVLVACGGSGIATHGVPAQVPAAGTPGSGAPSTAAIVNGKVAQPFSVTFARANALTKIGIASSAEANSPEHDVTLGSAAGGCSAVGLNEQCAFTLSLPWGPQILTVTTYGASVTRTQLRVGLAGTRIALATGVAVAQISLDLAENAFASNLAATTSLYVTARDVNGNTIVGSFGTTITVASSDTSGATSLSATTVAQSTDSPLTVTYNGNPTTGPSVTFTATASGVPASAITSATLSFTASQVLYVGNQKNIEMFARSNALGDVTPLNRISLPGYIPFDVMPDGQGNLLVLAGFDAPNNVTTQGLLNTTFFKIPASSSGPVSNPTPFGLVLPNNQPAVDAAVDSSGNVYVLSSDFQEDGGTAISVFAPGATTPSRVITGPATQLGTGVMNALAATDSGVVAVNQTIADYDFGEQQPGTILIFGANANGNATPQRTITGNATGLSSWGIGLGMTYLAWLPDGSLAATDISFNDVSSLFVFAPGANGNATPTRNISGGATGINVNTSYVFTGRPTSGTIYGENGLAADNAGRLYVSVFGSSVGLPSQIVRFDATANGNVVPSAVLAGNLTGLGGPGKLTFASAVITPSSQLTPSVSGDFLAVTANRGWNYSVIPGGNGAVAPAAPGTVTLYADPQLSGSDNVLVLLEEPGVEADATAGQFAAYMSVNSASGGYTTTGYYSQTNFAGGPIPGGLQLVLPSLTRGQQWSPYPGLTANVTDVATNVIGSAACPGGTASIGATVLYTFGFESERITYVPGCGITHMVTDNGTQITLTSIGSYPQLGQLSEARQPASLRAVSALRNVWRSVFTPWSPR
jgi:hypothetical protein